MVVSKTLIGVSILLMAGLLTTLVSIYKKKVVTDIGAIGFKEIKSFDFWFGFFTDTRILLILGVMGIVFLLNILVFSLMDVNKIFILNWAFMVPFFLLTAFLSHKYLGEVITKEQYLGVSFMIVSTVLSIIGIYLYYK